MTVNKYFYLLANRSSKSHKNPSDYIQALNLDQNGIITMVKLLGTLAFNIFLEKLIEPNNFTKEVGKELFDRLDIENNSIIATKNLIRVLESYLNIDVICCSSQAFFV
jgi:hypothetical protein